MKKSRELLLILVIFAAFGLNYPWLSIVSKQLLIFGIPLLYFYLFGLWLLFIALVYVLIRHASKDLENKTEVKTDDVK